ncbi:MAG: TA system VapC family ribonuclease toxin [Terrimicrobiaceae bacterium]|nr:TA system VapC family ribonuclease toxin [Terrimicrobiaceae bacterium]
MPVIDIPDLNLWLALIDGDHTHHVRARRYWEEEAASHLGFCRVTMLGLLRLLTNARVMHGAPFTAAEAWEAYRAFAALPEVCFVEDSVVAENRFELWSRVPGFPADRWTDAWIAAIASSVDARAVSFDRDFRMFGDLDLLHLRP